MKLTPRPHQQKALSAINTAMAASDRALVVMACGTGKTLVSLWAVQDLTPTTVLVLVPSLNLLQQTFHEWKAHHQFKKMKSLCVCSDQAIGQSGSDDLLINPEDFDFPTTTYPVDVGNFLEQSSDREVSVIFSTYHSANVVGEGLVRSGKSGFDVAIFDEAHKTVGAQGKAFSYALLDENIPIKKRLFFTATPRILNTDKKQKNSEDGYSMLTMDSEAIYGARIHELTFSEAARQKIIVPYKIVVSVIDGNEISSEDLSKLGVKTKDSIVSGVMMADKIALSKAVESVNAKKVITFHKTVDDAKKFSQLDDNVFGSGFKGFKQLHVSGAQKHDHRELQMDKFKNSEFAMISNSRCLTEGVDVPSVDMVAFMHNKKSAVDIIQAAGRAMRLAPGKTMGYIMVPVHIDRKKDLSTEDSVRKSDFSVLIDILRSLMISDKVLESQICSPLVRQGINSREKSNFPFTLVGADNSVDKEKLYASITSAILDDLRSTFDEFFANLSAYKKANGHCNVPQMEGTLGNQVSSQRTKALKSDYPRDRRERLSSIGFSWNVYDAVNDQRLAELSVFKKDNGHCHVPQSSGVLGKWIAWQKHKDAAGKLSVDLKKQLTELGAFDKKPHWSDKLPLAPTLARVQPMPAVGLMGPNPDPRFYLDSNAADYMTRLAYILDTPIKKLYSNKAILSESPTVKTVEIDESSGTSDLPSP